MSENGITVIMPTYNQGTFISRAIKSVLLQKFTQWELLIVIDGSTDNTLEVVESFCSDSRIRYIVNSTNKGLGYALNVGLEEANFNYIAYLPSDDLYFSEHLLVLWSCLKSHNDYEFICSGVKYNYLDGPGNSSSRKCFGPIEVLGYLLVQVLHRKTQLRWVERDLLVTDSLYEMFWNSYLIGKTPKFTMSITSEWTNHPNQRHKIICENLGGGINKYKQYYKVRERLRYKSTFGNFIDEHSEYNKFTSNSAITKSGKLKILLVGELAYNAERILALEELGHTLFGLWIDSPCFFNTVGPLPFGNIQDLSIDTWQQDISLIKPDVIYALLNHQSVPLIHAVISKKLDIPLVWHFKEGPFYCRQYGLWDKMIDIFNGSDANIFTNLETKLWFEQFVEINDRPYLIIDGDLPHKSRFEGERSPIISENDGAIHTVITGRPLGLETRNLAVLASHDIHVHIYGDFYHNAFRNWMEDGKKFAPNHLHFHPSVPPHKWVSELSQYDAGWLHLFDCQNYGEFMRASWLELNYPARMSTFGAAGLPMIQKNNQGHICASQNFCKNLGFGIFFSDIEDLAGLLKDKLGLQKQRKLAWEKRHVFSFHSYVNPLSELFYKVIHNRQKRNLENKNKDVNKIPRLIHQIYSKGELPDHYKDLSQSWKLNHQDWELIVWTDQSMTEFIAIYYPSFLFTFSTHLCSKERDEIFRYFVLYSMGGVFVSIDSECNRNVSLLIEDYTTILGYEPSIHASKFRAEFLLHTGFLACTKGNLFFRNICETIQVECLLRLPIPDESIPSYYTQFLTERYTAFGFKSIIKILDSSIMTPLDINEVTALMHGNSTIEIQNKLDDAYAVNYFLQSWFRC